jgi:transcriptional regulator GlxA family with amidase domain
MTYRTTGKQSVVGAPRLETPRPSQRQLTSSKASRRTASAILTEDERMNLLDFIHSNLEKKIYIQDLAAKVSLTRRELVGRLRGSYGCPPKRFILKCRVERSKVEMMTTERALSDIALKCGFADQSHFNRVFRRFTGKTPFSWRANWASGTAAIRTPPAPGAA